MPRNRSDRSIKLLVVGDSGAGKTCLIRKFVTDTYTECYTPTAGEPDILVRTLFIDGENVTLDIWDTLGQERFLSLAPLHYRGADGAIIVFSLTDRSSFARIRVWIDTVIENCGDNIPRILVGCQCDDHQRQVAKVSILEQTNEMDLRYFETSAKVGINVDQAFQHISKLARAAQRAKEEQAREENRRTTKNKPSGGSDIVWLRGSKEGKTKKNKGCCTSKSK